VAVLSVLIGTALAAEAQGTLDKIKKAHDHSWHRESSSSAAPPPTRSPARSRWISPA